MDVPGEHAQKKSQLSTISISSDDDLNVYCQPCDQEGPRLPAYGFCRDCSEHLCETCFKVHRRHKLSRHHNLLDKESMPQTLQLPPTSGQASETDDFTKRCPKHKNEMIKFYCHDHEVLLCSVCVTLEHPGTICKVNYIPDISGQIVNKKERQDILKTMDSFSDQCQKMSEDVENMIGNSNSSLTDVLSVIKKFRNKIIHRLDELARQAEDAANAIQQNNDKYLKTVETTCVDLNKSLKTSFDSIKHHSASKQSDRLFMELKFAEQVMKGYEKIIHQLTTSDIKEYTFQPNEAISNLFEKEKSLGTLTHKTLKQPCPPPTIAVKSRQTSPQDKICLQTSADNNFCQITGMTLLTPNLLIITDWYHNRSIKMVDTCSQSVIDQLKLDNMPYDVTSVTKNEVCVTLPFKHYLQFISVSSNKLAKKHIQEVDGACYGISCYQGKIVVVFCGPPKFQIFDTNGTILTTIRLENGFSNHNPFYVTTNISYIYVSDWKMKTLTRLNWQGEVLCSYGSFDTPYGISLSDDGTVFVCDDARNVIEEIPGDCSGGKVVLKGQKDLKHPCAICWCAETNMLYISCHSDNFLHAIKLSYI